MTCDSGFFGCIDKETDPGFTPEDGDGSYKVTPTVTHCLCYWFVITSQLRTYDSVLASAILYGVVY